MNLFYLMLGLFTAGAACLAVGAFLISPAAGFITVGVLAMGAGLLIDFGNEDDV